MKLLKTEHKEKELSSIVSEIKCRIVHQSVLKHFPFILWFLINIQSQFQNYESQNHEIEEETSCVSQSKLDAAGKEIEEDIRILKKALWHLTLVAEEELSKKIEVYSELATSHSFIIEPLAELIDIRERFRKSLEESESGTYSLINSKIPMSPDHDSCHLCNIS